MDYKVLLVFFLLLVLVSIQYTLNKILLELKSIKKNILDKKMGVKDDFRF